MSKVACKDANEADQKHSLHHAAKHGLLDVVIRLLEGQAGCAGRSAVAMHLKKPLNIYCSFPMFLGVGT